MSRLRQLAALPAGRHTKWLFALAWIVIMAIAAPLAGKIGDVEENDAAAFLPRSAEATKYSELLPQFESDEMLSAVVVYARDAGIADHDRAHAERTRETILRYVPEAERERVPALIPAPDGKALLVTLPLANDDGLIDDVDGIRQEVRKDAPEGLNVKVSGAAGGLTDSVKVFEGLDAKLLLISAGIVALLLLLTYRSPVMWLIPLISVAVASQVAGAAVYLLGKYADLPVDGQSGGILPVLVFAIGTDYALLLVARYREELHRHVDRHAAMKEALRRAGPAIVASAATVTIGLACLLTADLNSNRSLGGVGAIGVLCGLIAMMTLLPALLVFFGRWVFWPFIPRFGTPVRESDSVWGKLGRLIARRPRITWVGTAGILLLLAVAATQLNLGLTQEQAFRDKPESVVGQELIGSYFPAGASQPTEVIARAATRDRVTNTLRETEGVAEVQPAVTSTNGELIRIGAVLSSKPDTATAEQTVERIRDRVHEIPGANALVGGPTAVNLDTETAAERDRLVIIPLVLTIVFIILALLLRSLLAPFLLMATVVLSYFAALGISALFLEQVFGIAAVDHSLPLLGFVFLVALGVDYNIFLMTRVREEVQQLGHAPGVLAGLATTGGVITSAGLVLAATFTVLATTPSVFLIGVGVLVALGVLLDTFVVRSVLVPALSLDIGPRIWWPSRISKGSTVLTSDSRVEPVKVSVT